MSATWASPAWLCCRWALHSKVVHRGDWFESCDEKHFFAPCHTGPVMDMMEPAVLCPLLMDSLDLPLMLAPRKCPLMQELCHCLSQQMSEAGVPASDGSSLLTLHPIPSPRQLPVQRLPCWQPAPVLRLWAVHLLGQPRLTQLPAAVPAWQRGQQRLPEQS